MQSKSKTFSQLQRHIARIGGDTSHFEKSSSRLVTGSEPVWNFDEMTDEELVQYDSILAATIEHPPYFMDKNVALREQTLARREIDKRGIDAS